MPRKPKPPASESPSAPLTGVGGVETGSAATVPERWNAASPHENTPNPRQGGLDYLALLRQHLADPAFRATPGFPAGSDEDILARSHPPYYTACPNPFLAEFLAAHARPADPGYTRQPFAADTTAGKTHPIYTAHAYHSKVPHQAIAPYIEHFTAPGDIVLDGFSGSGMTGVAAQLAGRAAVLVDLSPVAGFIGYNLNLDVEAASFRRAGDAFFARLEAELGWMYETTHPDGRRGRVSYTVWSELLVCPHCQAEFPYVEAAHEPESGSFKRQFPCPGCAQTLKPRQARRRRERVVDVATGEPLDRVVYAPIELHYTLPGEKTRHRKPLDAADRALLDRLAAEAPADWFPTATLPLGAIRDSRHLADRGVTRYHHFYFPRALHALAVMWRLAGEEPDRRIRQFLTFMVEQAVWGLTKQNRYGANFYSQANRFLGGVYYFPPACSELSPWALLKGKYQRLLKLLEERRLPEGGQVLVSVASTPHLDIPENSVDYVFTDPPFGDAIKYGDLNLLIEAWHRLHSRVEDEVLWDELKHKGLDRFQAMLKDAFAVYHRALKPGRWMTVVFHNSNHRVWDAIQEAILEAGFVVADVHVLDRRQGSYNQVTAAGAVKNDLVISAYKPAGAERGGALLTASADEAWGFVREHLAALAPEDSAERDPQMLYSRVVAHHLRQGRRVPFSAPAFYEGLKARVSGLASED